MPATSATCISRSSSAPARRRCSSTRSPSWPSTPRSRTSTTGRSAARATIGSRTSSRDRPRFASSCCTTTFCRCPAPGASATSSTTPATSSRCCRSAASTSCWRAQARALRLASRAPVRDQRRHLQLAAPARPHQGLLQHRAARRRSRGGGAQVPLPRHRDAHRLRAVHGVVREVHVSRSRGGWPIGETLPRAVVVIDGEHYPPVVATALDGLRQRYDVVAGIFAGGCEKLRGGGAAAPGLAAGPGAGLDGLARELGLPWLAGVEPGGDVAARLEAVRATLREARADALVDLSDEPVIGYRERFLLMSAALAEGARLA